MKISSSLRAPLSGAIVWGIVCLIWQPRPTHDEWARMLLLLAALVWLQPGFLPTVAIEGRYRRWLGALSLPSAMLLALSMFMPSGAMAFVLSLPWLCVTGLYFLQGAESLFQTQRGAGLAAVSGAQIFILVGGLWTAADRLGLQPLGFDPAIVLLTGVHFHYAGFIFPLLTGLIAIRRPGFATRLAVWLSLISVPLTAIGITVVQMKGSPLPETAAAATVALAGWLCAAAYFTAVLRESLPATVKLCWTIAAFGLIFSMTLAFLYAIRPYFPIETLNIPYMRALHGSVNAIGVGGCGLLGWRLLGRKAWKTPL